MLSSVLLVLLGIFANLVLADRCTAITVGRSASTNGATMTTHANDCFDCDFRIVKVPRRSHEKGSTRSIPPMKFSFPRQVSNRSLHYRVNSNNHGLNWTESKSIGEIPEAAETYGIIEGSYSIMNEHGVSLGESTCGAKQVSAPIYAGGRALFDVTELGRIALERSRTARDAVRMMGRLAQEHGYFSAAWEGEGAEGEGGEAYVVSDAFENWVFHMCPDDSGASAVWVAKRVPDNHVTVLANTFIIRQVPQPQHADPDIWLISSNLHTVASKLGFWRPDDGPLDFKRAFGLTLPVFKEPYVSRRMWRVFDTVAPSLQLSPALTSFELPFSVQPDEQVSLDKVKLLHRDHFEGTAYDTTQGLAAGPFGNPNRYDAYGEARLSALASKVVSVAREDAKKKNVRDLTGNKFIQFLPIGPGMIPEDVLRAAGQDAQLQCRFDGDTADNMCLASAVSWQSTVLDTFVRMAHAEHRESLQAVLAGSNDDSNLDKTQGDPLTDQSLQEGHFERTISLFRTSYTSISVALPAVDGIREGAAYTVGPNTLPSKKPVVLPKQAAFVTHIGLHQAKTSVFVPAFPALPFHLPQSFLQGSLYGSEPDSAWWIFSIVSNYAERAWRFIVRDIEHVQTAQEQKMTSLVEAIQADIGSSYNQLKSNDDVYEWNSLFDPILGALDDKALYVDKVHVTSVDEAVVKFQSAVKDGSSVLVGCRGSTLTISVKQAARVLGLLQRTAELTRAEEGVVSSWWTLFWRITTRYHDGYRFDEPTNLEYTATPLFYPTWWLRAVRFWRQHNTDATVTGKEYITAAPSVVPGVKSEYASQYTGFGVKAVIPPNPVIQEKDIDWYPGDQCDAPRNYQGTGQYAYIDDDFTETARRNGDKVAIGCHELLQSEEQAAQASSSSFSIWWIVVVAVCAFAGGYIFGHTTGTTAGSYSSIPVYTGEDE